MKSLSSMVMVDGVDRGFDVKSGECDDDEVKLNSTHQKRLGLVACEEASKTRSEEG